MVIGIFGVLFAAWVLILLVQDRRRTAAIKELALRINFKFLGNSLPGDLDLLGKVFAHGSSGSNVIEGERCGVRVIAFDGSVDTGRFSFRRTYIAVSRPASVLPEWRRRLEGEPSGEWAIFFASRSYYFRSLMPVSRLSSYLESL